jgi:hypothetical protein
MFHGVIIKIELKIIVFTCISPYLFSTKKNQTTSRASLKTGGISVNHDKNIGN